MRVNQTTEIPLAQPPLMPATARKGAQTVAKVDGRVDFTLFIDETERDAFDKIRHRTIQPAQAGRPAVTLGTVFELLAQGLRTKHILKAKPHILPETMTLAHSYLMVHMPQTYTRVVDQNRAAAGRHSWKARRDWDVKVLVDENLTTTLCPSIRAMIGQPRHVNLIGLRGTKDPQLWEWAVNNGIDVIITKDRATSSDQDLTRIADNAARAIMRQHLLGELPKDKLPETSIDMVLSIMRNDLRDGQLSSGYNELPLVVHIVDDRHERGLKHIRQADYVAMLLRKHRDTIFTYIENRNTPVILVRNRKVECGPTYNELLMNVARETMGQLQLEFMTAHGDLAEVEKARLAQHMKAEYYRAANDPNYDSKRSKHLREMQLGAIAAGIDFDEPTRMALAKRAYTERVFFELTHGFNLSAERMEKALEMAKAAANRFGPGSAPTGTLITRREGATPIYTKGPNAWLP